MEKEIGCFGHNKQTDYHLCLRFSFVFLNGRTGNLHQLEVIGRQRVSRMKAESAAVGLTATDPFRLAKPTRQDLPLERRIFITNQPEGG